MEEGAGRLTSDIRPSLHRDFAETPLVRRDTPWHGVFGRGGGVSAPRKAAARRTVNEGQGRGDGRRWQRGQKWLERFMKDARTIGRPHLSHG